MITLPVLPELFIFCYIADPRVCLEVAAALLAGEWPVALMLALMNLDSSRCVRDVVTARVLTRRHLTPQHMPTSNRVHPHSAVHAR